MNIKNVVLNALKEKIITNKNVDNSSIEHHFNKYPTHIWMKFSSLGDFEYGAMDWLEKYDRNFKKNKFFKKYIFNDDMTISCKASIDISNRDIIWIPIQFKSAISFDCSNNNLLSLVGSPLECDFLIANNNKRIKNFKGVSKGVKKLLNLNSCGIESFDDMPSFDFVKILNIVLSNNPMKVDSVLMSKSLMDSPPKPPEGLKPREINW